MKEIKSKPNTDKKVVKLGKEQQKVVKSCKVRKLNYWGLMSQN